MSLTTLSDSPQLVRTDTSPSHSLPGTSPGHTPSGPRPRSGTQSQVPSLGSGAPCRLSPLSLHADSTTCPGGRAGVELNYLCGPRRQHHSWLVRGRHPVNTCLAQQLTLRADGHAPGRPLLLILQLPEISPSGSCQLFRTEPRCGTDQNIPRASLTQEMSLNGGSVHMVDSARTEGS